MGLIVDFNPLSLFNAQDFLIVGTLKIGERLARRFLLAALKDCRLLEIGESVV